MVAHRKASSRRKESLRPRSLWRDNGLTIVLVSIFVLLLAGQMVVGVAEYNQERSEHKLPALTLIGYLASPHFLEAVSENWESEFLQMGAYVILTAMLFQRGSAESNDPDEPGDDYGDPARHRKEADAPWPVRRGGWILVVYENSLSLAFIALFVVSIAIHAISGAGLHNEEQLAHGGPPETIGQYLRSPTFWFESLQNWQSEFLAIALMVTLSIHLRQRGSAESKPVHAPHSQTGA